jgi:hypothetical protein
MFRGNFGAVYPHTSTSKRKWKAILLIGCLTWTAHSSNAQDAQVDGIVFWPRLDFVIPFQVDANGQQPREVILEYSDTQGQSWQVYERGSPRTRQFQFLAPGDGLYLFRLKTVDSEGRKFNNPGAPLKIAVDTVKPVAKLIVDMDQRGALQAQFLVSDTALDTESIQLEYQTEFISSWKSIPFELAPSTTLGEWTGFGTWSLTDDSKQLVVRIRAKDRAGNETEATRLPQLPRTALGNRPVTFASQNRSTGQDTRDPKSNGKPAIGSGVQNPTNELPRVQSLGQSQPTKLSLDTETAGKPRVDEDYLSIEQRENMRQHRRSLGSEGKYPIPANSTTSDQRSLPEQGVSLSQLNASMKEMVDAKTVPSPPVPGLGLQKPNFPLREMSESEIEAASRSETYPFAGLRSQPAIEVSESLTSGSLSAISTRETIGFAEPRPLNAGRLPYGPSQAEPGLSRLTESREMNSGLSVGKKPIEPLCSNTKAFSLDYRIENDLGAPVAEVELWGTTDDGKTWELWGQDPDRKSPFDIEVESAGLFGFRMVIVGVNGLASNRPRNGDNADAWILVDFKTPTVKLSRAVYGTGREAGSMIIEYQAQDEHFGERPISFYYSESPEGPWQVISKGVRNQGRFVWPADPNLPPSVYLKIEAVDGAGNTAENVLDAPIRIEGIAPRGRIQGFRPIRPAN